jgi:hypothetical protein
MNTTKSGKGEGAGPQTRPSQEDLLAAYQAHTLAQMLYGQFLITYPWIGQAHTLPHGEPWTGAGVAPWTGYGPSVWGAGPAALPGPQLDPAGFQVFPRP